MATVVAIPLGVLSASRRDSGADFAGRVAGLIGLSIPSFWLATLTLTVAFAMVTAGVGLLHGQLGLTSLGQVTFAGIGAWTMLRLHFATSLPFLPLLLGPLTTTDTGLSRSRAVAAT